MVILELQVNDDVCQSEYLNKKSRNNNEGECSHQVTVDTTGGGKQCICPGEDAHTHSYYKIDKTEGIPAPDPVPGYSLLIVEQGIGKKHRNDGGESIPKTRQESKQARELIEHVQHDKTHAQHAPTV